MLYFKRKTCLRINEFIIVGIPDLDDDNDDDNQSKKLDDQNKDPVEGKESDG